MKQLGPLIECMSDKERRRWLALSLREEEVGEEEEEEEEEEEREEFEKVKIAMCTLVRCCCLKVSRVFELKKESIFFSLCRLVIMQTIWMIVVGIGMTYLSYVIALRAAEGNDAVFACLIIAVFLAGVRFEWWLRWGRQLIDRPAGEGRGSPPQPRSSTSSFSVENPMLLEGGEGRMVATKGRGDNNAGGEGRDAVPKKREAPNSEKKGRKSVKRNASDRAGPLDRHNRGDQWL